MSMKDRLLVLASMLIAGGGCTTAVTEAQMQDRAQVALIAQKVSTQQNNHARAKRIAFIGIEAPNQVKEHNGYNPGGVAGHIVGAVEGAKSMIEKSKALACRALDASFDQYTKSLTDAGFELVPFEEKLQQPQFQIFTGTMVPDWCQASRAPARLNYVNPFAWKDTFRVVQQLIDALGVDAIVMAQLGANDLKSGDSTLSLYVKHPDGVARVGWSGRVSKGKFRFDAVQPGETDEAKIANAARVFAHSFDLMATKMRTEAKP